MTDEQKLKAMKKAVSHLFNACATAMTPIWQRKTLKTATQEDFEIDQKTKKDIDMGFRLMGKVFGIEEK
jgi:hypothetical protein